MVAVYLQARHQMTSPQNGEMCYVPRYKIIDQFIGKFDITAGKELYISHNLIIDLKCTLMHFASLLW